MCAGGWLGERVCVRNWFECMCVWEWLTVCVLMRCTSNCLQLAKPSKVT